MDYSPHFASDGGMQPRWMSDTTAAWLTVNLGKEESFSKIVIFEYQDSVTGEVDFSNVRTGRIQEYSIDLFRDGVWETIYVSDDPMGDCKTIRFPRAYSGTKVRLNVLKASEPPSVWEFEVLK